MFGTTLVMDVTTSSTFIYATSQTALSGPCALFFESWESTCSTTLCLCP